MEPRIQYVTTPDDVSIAYWSIGEGIPIFYMTGPPFNHIQLEWRMHSYRQYYELLAETYRVIRFDARGSGLSDRNVSDLSLEALVTDLETVADRLGIETFVALGAQSSGLVALEYALRRPGRVSHLVLWDTYASAKEFLSIPRVRAFTAMIETDWELFTEAVAGSNFGWGSGGTREFAAFVREATTPEGTRAFFDSLENVDLTRRLGEVSQPTLVMHHKPLTFPQMDTARVLASRIPNAELVVLDGTWGEPGDDMDDISRALARLLGTAPPAKRVVAPGRESRLGRIVGSVLDAVDRFEESEEKRRAAREGSQSRTPGGLATILFTDVEDSTALTQRLGDAAARELLREHERITRDALSAHGGSEVKTMGDGFMASFGSATAALECAIEIQRNLEQGARNKAQSLRVRVGLNAGEPIVEDDPDGRSDLFGTAVIIAARIAALAHGGEILVSDVVRQLVAGKGFLFNDRGEHALKGFEDPVRVWEARWRENG